MSKDIVGETLLRILVEDPSHPSRTDNGSEIVEGSRFSTGDFDNLISPAKEARSGSLCTPTVRTLAKQYGVDVNDVCGTGKDGRVLREDILNYAVNKGIIDEKLTPSNAYEEDQQKQRWQCEDKKSSTKRAHNHRGYQRAMVKSMTLASKVPHFHYLEEINCNGLVQLKASLQAQNADPNVKFTFLPLLVTKELSRLQYAADGNIYPASIMTS
ncbi:hypothetical protein Leryth_020432 [Lithospermum erythrorhizon]|nr:hypothetical protein Leryth_020432 [Lithospermum erythrorhizon]